MFLLNVTNSGSLKQESQMNIFYFAIKRINCYRIQKTTQNHPGHNAHIYCLLGFFD